MKRSTFKYLKNAYKKRIRNKSNSKKRRKAARYAMQQTRKRYKG